MSGPNPEFHTCHGCGFTWRHGHSGAHNCGPRVWERLRDMARLANVDQPQNLTTHELLKALQERLQGLLELELPREGS